MNQHGMMFLLMLIFSLLGYGFSTPSENPPLPSSSTEISSTAPNLITVTKDDTLSEPSQCPPNGLNSAGNESTETTNSSNNLLCIYPPHAKESEITKEKKEFYSLKLCLVIILLLLALTASGFLIAYLKISFKKKAPRTLLLKITSSYCFTLLVLYTSSVISFILFNFDSVRTAEIIIQYCIYSLLLWSCIITYECWQCFIKFKDYKVDSNKSKWHRRKEYLIRCCFAWITPVLIPINTFFCPQFEYGNQTENWSINSPFNQSNDLSMYSLRCPQLNHTINDDLLSWTDFVADQHSSTRVNLIVTISLAAFIILPSLHICVRFRALLVEVGNADTNNSKKKRSHQYMVYGKLLCVTGALWVLSSFLIFLDDICPSIGIIVCFLVATYGILLCTSLGMKNHSFYSILRGHMNRVFIRRFPDGISMSHVGMAR